MRTPDAHSKQTLVEPCKNSPLATDLVSPPPATCKTWKQEGNKVATGPDIPLPPILTQELSWLSLTTSLSGSSCLPWHHSIAGLANDKVLNRYLSRPGPSLRQHRPPPDALQLRYSMWRTTASSQRCSCWLQRHTTCREGMREGRKEGRPVYTKASEVGGIWLSYFLINVVFHFY